MYRTSESFLLKVDFCRTVAFLKQILLIWTKTKAESLVQASEAYHAQALLTNMLESKTNAVAIVFASLKSMPQLFSLCSEHKDCK